MAATEEDDQGAAARAAALTQRQWPLLVVLLVMLVGLGLAWYSWPLGCLIVSAALGLAALLRLLLPQRWAGLLVVRNRFFDVAFALVVGAGLVALVLSRI